MTMVGPRLTRTFTCAGLAFAISGLTLGCGADDGDDAAGEGALRVTTLQACSEAHVAWAIEKGVFEDHDVDVELVPTRGGAAGLAALVAGEADIASSNPVSAILAHSQGFEIKLVSNSFNANLEGEGISEGVVARTGTSITGPGDLKGQRVAVNEIGSQNHIFTANWIRAAGVDPADVSIIAVPFPEMTGAMTDGRVDAAMLTGSQAAALVAGGDGDEIGNPLADVIGPTSLAAYIATEKVVEERGEQVSAFVDALAEADEAATDPANRDEVLEIMSDFCEAPVEALRGVRFPAWSTSLGEGTLEDTLQVMVEESIVSPETSLDGLLADTAATR